MTTPAPTSEIGYVRPDSRSWWSVLEQETTPELRWPLSLGVYERMSTQDAQVRSMLLAITLPVLRTQWRVDPAAARPEVARAVADDLALPVVGQQAPPVARTRDRFSWQRHLQSVLATMPRFGHSFYEQLYRWDGQRWRLRKLAARPPRSISKINVAEDGGLVSVEQDAVGLGRSHPVIPVRRLVAYVHDPEPGSWTGTSVLRPVYKNWLLKDDLLRRQNQIAERNGMGMPLYTGAEGEEDLARGSALAQSWRAGDAAGAAVPYGAQMQLLGVDGTLPDLQAQIRYHDEQIIQSVLAHFLKLGTQTGSWALGSTFADFFTLSLQALGEEIADIATQHVVEDLVDVNWGESEPAPRLVFDEIGSRQQASAQAIKALVDAGVLFPDRVMEEAVRQMMGLPAKDRPS
jgi:hypothetical protein